METIKNTAPMTNELGQKLKRRFLGKTENFAHKHEAGYYKRMLKAYLKGYTTFSFGRDSFGNDKKFNVQQQYYYA